MSLEQEDKFHAIAKAARRILDAYGFMEPDSNRTVYADGDLNIATEMNVTEIIHRGTLVYRYAPEEDKEAQVFQDDGLWIELVERIAGDIPNPSS